MGWFNDIFSRGSDRPLSEKDRLNDLVKKASFSPTAKKILDEALKKGVQFKLESGLKDRGIFEPQGNTILLNKSMSDEVLLSTLVHEARHAAQGLGWTSANTLQSAFKVDRAQEADAMAFQCAAVYELQSVYPNVFKEFRASHPDISNAYVRNLQATKNQNMALQGAFKAWYMDTEYVAGYDRSTVDFMADKSSPARMLKDIPDTDISLKLCRNGGYSYMPDASFFNSQAACTLKQEVYEAASALEKKNIPIASRAGRRTSVDHFFVRQPDGRVRMPLIPRQPTAKPMSASQISSVISGMFR